MTEFTSLLEAGAEMVVEVVVEVASVAAAAVARV
jgi:hypothetical protein